MIEKVDFAAWEQILDNVNLYWGDDGPRIWHLHHPILFYEFGDTLFMIREEGRVSAYIMGFIGQKDPTVAYCHLISVHPEARGRGLGRKLYDHFAEGVRARGCNRIKAITGPDNLDSWYFHQKLGFVLDGEDDPRGRPIAHNYWGNGVDRMVFIKHISE